MFNLVICPRVPSGLPGSWRGCQPAGTSEKVMEVGVAAERVTFWAFFHVAGPLARWTIERGEWEAVLVLGGVT